jgi:GR25 family glycosyltransferase involved in LPS biosynthesis
MTFQNLDGIIYINLEHRQDRKKALLAELARLEVPEEKIHPIKGVFDIFNGHRGCAQSHIKALSLAHQLKLERFLVLEDDATFPYPINTTYQFLNEALMSLPKHWNVLLLGGNVMIARETLYPPLKQVLYAQSSHAYVVNKNYILTLKTCFENSLALMEQDIDYLESQNKKHSIDHQWKSLQTKDFWFVGTIIAQQRTSYSDITNTVYGSNFEDVGSSKKTALLKDNKHN